MLTFQREVSKTAAMYECSKCKNTYQYSKKEVATGKRIFCATCTQSLTTPKKTLRQKYPSEYSSYCHMVSRCTNPDDPDYARYGGRGISVCPEWLGSFDTFFLHMGAKPPDCNSIERQDYNGNYEPTNCVWANPTTQNRNRSCNHVVELNGKTQTVAEWIVELAVSGDAVYKRINRGVDPLEALTRVVREYKKKEVHD